ncbi:conserved hypothetical protein [Leishmania mexicana MHOM/GT/2001/U1103]|uniref:Uncharacterized protein n=1 Tax=Leishmania mexicana (strain MHOM/GT/2001/U1103) TaxID=929439 RepID=E9B1J7_LEIMU|nr:conserved hypothetical protein [Leishmania mexicana MHOM/GT/2001/U1103]CBZ29103.1 conserved hypothetical protein [Leishmania mexicana MHOM/GT/2001/U1103]
MAAPSRGCDPRPSLDPGIFFPEGSRPPQPLYGHGFLLHGARAVGKTSLAFQAAINTVQRTSGSVVVLCQESTLYAKAPQPFTPLSSLSESALGRIEFIYVEGWTAVLREMMGFHTTRAVPTLLLVDDDGFEVTVAADRRGKRSGQHPDVLVDTAAASCLSYLENLHDWMTRHDRPFFCVLVTNHLPEPATQLPLPYATFPLVNVWVGASATVQITTTQACGAAEVVSPPAYLTWQNGLRMRG